MPSLKVATLNLHLGSYRWLQRRELVVAQLLDVDADLIALQAVSPAIRQGQWLTNQLNARLADRTKEPYRYYFKRRQPFLVGYYESVGILSRMPVMSSDGIALKHQGRVALRVNVELPSGATLDFVSTHLHTEPFAVPQREEQIMRLMGWLHGRSSVDLRVVAGSLHAQPDEIAIARMKEFYSYRSAYNVTFGREPLATYPTALVGTAETIGTCQDYLFLSPRIRTIKGTRLICKQQAPDDEYLFPSAHVGIMSEIEI